MAAKPLTTEAIANTEKKMDMSLDDIIKMSKNVESKVKNQPRFSNKMLKFSNNVAQDKSRKLQHFMDSRSFSRQGAFAKRRSNFQGNQFALATEAARKAAVAPNRPRSFNLNRAFNWNKSRIVGTPVQRKTTNGAFNTKHQPPLVVQSQSNDVPRQKPQTLDLLFANMKEERLRVSSQRQNVAPHRNGRRQRIPPWGRARLGI